jgi:hypothetical protein
MKKSDVVAKKNNTYCLKFIGKNKHCWCEDDYEKYREEEEEYIDEEEEDVEEDEDEDENEDEDYEESKDMVIEEILPEDDDMDIDIDY